ncbi:MAG TPA: hypothetical protein VGM25_05900 [Caulobacteraceae bacterium]|jgi:hypothetical protein
MSDDVVTAAPARASAGGRAVDVRLPNWVSIIFGATLLLLVLGVLGRPSVFPDTAPYLDSGQTFWETIVAPLHPAPPAKAASPAVVERLHAGESLAISALASRRPWYGVFAWPLERVGTLWLLVAVQSGLAAWLIWLSWRVLAPEAANWTAYAVQGVSAGFSTLPFIAGFAMPDLFSSLMIIAVTLLLVGGERLHRNERTGLVVITGFATMAHGANLLVAGAMIALAAMAALRSAAARTTLLPPIYAVVCVLGLGLCANMLFDLKINLIHHQPPGRPPFLAARLLADGPGRIYLRQACAKAEPYLLCRHKAEPLDDSQAILWSGNKADAVFSVSLPPDRMILQRQEGRFVIGTVLNDPAGVAATAAANWVRQLGMVYTEAPLVDQRMYLGRPEDYPADPPRTNELYLPSWDASYYRMSALPSAIERLGDCTRTEPACRPRLSIPAATRLQISEFLAACVALAVIAARMTRQPRSGGGWLQALGFITFAVVVNALICGALSGPFPRYQSAVAWLTIMMAAVGGSSLLANRSRLSGPTG